MTATALDNRWKVILKPTITDTDFTDHLQKVCHAQRTGDLDQFTAPSPSESASRPLIFDVFTPDPDIVRYVFRIDDLRAYSGKFSPTVLAAIRGLPIVHHVQPVNRIFLRGQTVETNAKCWGLGAISHISGSSNEYAYDPEFKHQVIVYVIDTGVRITHTEFEGRASHGATFPQGPPERDTDLAGHGTHVAGTIAGRTCGVDRAAKIIAVKVDDSPNELGSGYDDGDHGDDSLAAGIQWAIKDATEPNGHQLRTVVNISMGATVDYITNDLVNIGFARGITFAVAGGNDGIPAISSPDCAYGALSVGFTEQGPPDKNGVPTTMRNSESRYGPNIDIFAPGTETYSCGILNDNSYETKAGTSMASPHVAGVAAYLLARETNLDSAAMVVARILKLATKNLVTNPGEYTQNLFLYNGSGQ